MIDRNDIRKMTAGHTPEFTLLHMFQEPAELIVAITKLELAYDEHPFDHELWKKRKADVVEELVDTLVMIEMIKEIYGIPESMVIEEAKNKMAKNLKRLESE